MNNLLTGVCNNIEQNIDKILLWKNSFEAVTDNDDVILVAYNPTGPDIKALEKHNIRYQGIRENSNETVNNMRLLPMADFLEDNKEYYNKVLYTDVFDVAFLKDPFTKITDDADIFVAGEGVLHREEPWNTDVMNKCFPSYTQLTKEQEVYCSGVIAGDIQVLSKYLRQMNTECLTSKKGHDIEDQAAMNIVIYKDMLETGAEWRYYGADDANNTDPTRNKIETRHVSGTNYTDVVVSALLDYGEPDGQDAFDTAADTEQQFVFDELGLRGYSSTGTGRLITHVIFHPVQKSLNRLIQIDYTVRVQSLSGGNS